MTLDRARVADGVVTGDPFARPPGPVGIKYSALLPFLRPHRTSIAIGCALSVVAAVASLAQPLAMIGVIDAFATGSSVLVPMLVLAAVFLADAVFSGLQSYVILRAGEALGLSVRTDVIGTILRWRVERLESYRSGDLVSRIGNDVSALRSVLGDSTVNILGAVLTLIGGVVIMVLIDPVLFLVSIVTAAVTSVFVVLCLSRIQVHTEEAQHAIGEMSADLDRAVSGFRTVAAFVMRDRERGRILDRATRAYTAGRRAAAWDAATTPALLIGLNGAVLVVFGVGGVRVASGELDFATFVSFILCFAVLVGPVLLGAESLAAVQRGLAALARVIELTEDRSSMRVEIDCRADVVDPGSDGPVAVRFDRVSFRFPGEEHAVIDDESFAVQPGTITALAGPSGSGKTTALSLTIGFYRPSSGAVLLDGREAHDMAEESLFARTAYVEQLPPVFYGTLRDNLSYGSAVDDAELTRLCAAVGLDHLIGRRDAGLSTMITDRGASLSGGERQRVGLVRALVRRPRLLVLDEPTSALDPDTEAAVLSVLARLRPTCTVLLASHRKSTLDVADRVIRLG